ncbi:MAG: threonylcarbamoyl-AMP synthase [Clostridiales Family XIII bacterium]|jgi:L-threonylcarbamoyladenylate synthase|nr:threonylcarbamoyl-AMP synthase [Clostridiales Family XIII bacterium]
MKTEIFDVTKLNGDVLESGEIHAGRGARRDMDEALRSIRIAAKTIRAGGLVAFPTETVYGLGCDAFNEAAVKKVYAAKGRPSDNPMIVHIARASDVGALTPRITPEFVRLADSFWPGPLTMILKKKECVPDATTGGLDTVAVRLPDHPAALELIRASGCPLAAPSANLSGSPSPTKAEHVIRDLSGKADVILAGSDSRVGIESAVLDLTSDIPTILRPGVLSADVLSEVLGREVVCDDALLRDGVSSGAAPKSPGMKYRHYAPKAEMLIVEGSEDRVRAEINRLKSLNERLGAAVGVMLFDERAYAEAARDFYARLRELDDLGVDLILAGALSDRTGIGFAIMNRMFKSAGYRVVKV